MDDIIIVEGLHDEIKIKSIYPNANCIITNGSEISQQTLDLIKKMSENHSIIIFTDPDFPGEKIRKTISDLIPSAKHAFLRKKDCISSNHKKVGIEHASKESIKKSLENIYSNSIIKDTINIKDLYELGLNGTNNSSILRDKVSDYLNIGKPNAKTFLKRLNLIQITKDELKEIICKVK